MIANPAVIGLAQDAPMAGLAALKIAAGLGAISYGVIGAGSALLRAALIVAGLALALAPMTGSAL